MLRSVRRVMRISEITGLSGNEYRMQEIFGFRQGGVDADGMAKGSFYATGHVPQCLGRLAEVGIELPERLFQKRTIKHPAA